MSKEKLIGRKEEVKFLDRFFKSNKAEFLAIYGRRRVGKTFLITQYFKNKGILFEVTGVNNANNLEQIDNFFREFCALFKAEDSPDQPKNWTDAFVLLTEQIKKLPSNHKVVVFFDELPWLASPKSGFLKALDYFWNRHWSRIPNLLLIVSGSAASWMINHVINDTGGLYGRLSGHLRLIPFTLNEVKEYLFSKGIDLPLKQICEIYMVTGGVPKYLSFIDSGLSSAQCIHNLCFTPQSVLLTEFHKLFRSLFKYSETHVEIVKILAKRRKGLSKTQLLKLANLKGGGTFSKILRELEESGFIMAFPLTGKSKKNAHYYLIDEYSLFYLNWIDPVKSIILHGVDQDYWIKLQTSQNWKIWAGFAFESICLKHITKIKEALGIGSVNTKVSQWTSMTSGKKDVEVDLVIERADQCINLCEIKFYNSRFTVTQAYARDLNTKKEIFAEKANLNKALLTVLITPYGALENSSYKASVDKQITLECLF